MPFLKIIVKGLRWSERYTETDMLYLTRGGLWLLLSQGTNLVMTFVLVWCFANLLSPDTYGHYRFLTSMALILAITALPGMKVAVTRAVARGSYGVVSQAVRARIVHGLIGSVLAMIAAAYYFAIDNSEIAIAFALIAVTVPLLESFDVVLSYQNGQKRYDRYALIASGRYLAIVVATILAISLTDQLLVILATYLFVTVASNGLFYLYYAKEWGTLADNDQETVSYGIKLTLAGSLNQLLNNVDKVILWYVAGPAMVAVYTIAIAIPKEINEAFNQIGRLALPKLSTTISPRHGKLNKKILIFFIGTVPAALAYTISAPFIFDLLLPQYANAVIYSQVAALLIVCSPLSLLTQYFNATMNMRAITFLGVAQPTIGLVLLATLSIFYGVLGAILALIGRQIFGFLLLLVFLNREKVGESEDGIV